MSGSRRSGSALGRRLLVLQAAVNGDHWGVAGEPGHEVRQFIDALVAFAQQRDDVRAVAVVGSHARQEARPGSDVDVVVLTTEPRRYTETLDWIGSLMGARLIATRRWGALTERRLVLAGGIEIDFGVAHTSWAATKPLDPGTARVARDGLMPLHDPDGLLAALAGAAARTI